MWDSIKKEIPNIGATVAEHDDEIYDLVDYQDILGHLIFVVKLGKNLRRKDRFVADRHIMDTPSYTTYINVVSRDSVRI